MRISVPALLTLNGGYTDTAGFLVLQGLFTGHVTGNFVASTPGIAFNTLVAIKVFLFILAAALAVIYGPFADADAWAAIARGMALVAGMAIQNAAHRIFFGKSPPSTVLTGTTAQLMIDVSDLAHPGVPAEVRAQARSRCAGLLKTVGLFAPGCAVAAVIYAKCGRMVLVVSPLISMAAFRPRFTL